MALTPTLAVEVLRIVVVVVVVVVVMSAAEKSSKPRTLEAFSQSSLVLIGAKPWQLPTSMRL
jgi:hypothetical protein